MAMGCEEHVLALISFAGPAFDLDNLSKRRLAFDSNFGFVLAHWQELLYPHEPGSLLYWEFAPPDRDYSWSRRARARTTWEDMDMDLPADLVNGQEMAWAYWPCQLHWALQRLCTPDMIGPPPRPIRLGWIGHYEQFVFRCQVMQVVHDSFSEWASMVAAMARTCRRALALARAQVCRRGWLAARKFPGRVRPRQLAPAWPVSMGCPTEMEAWQARTYGAWVGSLHDPVKFWHMQWHHPYESLWPRRP